MSAPASPDASPAGEILLGARPAPWCLGLTGGIGSGKSTVARWLQAQGCRLIDTDALARSLTLPGGEGLPAIAQVFGPEMIHAEEGLDRARMRERVFHDPEAKRQLEAILHPLIHAKAWQDAARQPQAAYCVFDIPLLVEGGEASAWRPRLDWIVVVDCPTELQRTRVQSRSGWPAETVDRVIAQQATRAQRQAWADTLLDNGGDLDHLTRQLEAWWPSWMATHAA